MSIGPEAGSWGCGLVGTFLAGHFGPEAGLGDQPNGSRAGCQLTLVIFWTKCQISRTHFELSKKLFSMKDRIFDALSSADPTYFDWTSIWGRFCQNNFFDIYKVSNMSIKPTSREAQIFVKTPSNSVNSSPRTPIFGLTFYTFSEEICFFLTPGQRP